MLKNLKIKKYNPLDQCSPELICSHYLSNYHHLQRHISMPFIWRNISHNLVIIYKSLIQMKSIISHHQKILPQLKDFLMNKSLKKESQFFWSSGEIIKSNSHFLNSQNFWLVNKSRHNNLNKSHIMQERNCFKSLRPKFKGY